MTQLSVQGLDQAWIEVSVIARFVTNGLTAIPAAIFAGVFLNLWLIEKSSYAKDLVGSLFFLAIFGLFFLNDIISLPVNIYYLQNLGSNLDPSDKWAQTIAFGSPIVSATLFVLGVIISTVELARIVLESEKKRDF